MMYALVPSVIVVGASWSYSQERMPCARVLRHRVYSPQPVRTASSNDCMAQKQCGALQVNGFHRHLEQSE